MKLFLLLFLFPLASWAQELKVLTWNTFLIPPPINVTKQKDRAKLMVEKLPAMEHEVMFFQETFFKKSRKQILTSLLKTHPYSAIPTKGRKLTHILDSGLMVVSKHPMEVLDQVIFKDCTVSDCASSKSAILVEVTIPSGKKVQLVNTHLQAWDKPKAIEVRKKQLLQIKEMLSSHLKPGIPQLLIGDLNIDGKLEGEFNEALALMEMTSTPLEGDISGTNGFATKPCFKKPGEDHEEWLDHFWLKANGTETEVLSKKVVPIIGQLKNKICPLSDHHAVEAIIKL